MAFPFYLIQDHIIPAKFRDPLSPPLGVEISNIFREGFLIQAVINLIKESRDLIGMLVFQSDPRLFLERHLEITVQSPAWHCRNRNGIYNTLLAESAAEKISQRSFHRRLLLIVPVHPQHQVSENKTVCLCGLVRHCDPDMMDHPRSLDLRQSHRLSALYIPKTGASFSGRAQMAGCHSSPSLLSCGIFCVYGSAFFVSCHKKCV